MHGKVILLVKRGVIVIAHLIKSVFSLYIKYTFLLRLLACKGYPGCFLFSENENAGNRAVDTVLVQPASDCVKKYLHHRAARAAGS